MSLGIYGFVAALVFMAGIMAPNHYFPWSSFYNEAPAAGALAILVVASLVFNREKYVEVPRKSIFVLAIALLPIAQLGMGKIHFGGDAWLAFAYLLGVLFAYVIGFYISRRLDCGVARVLDGLAWVLLIAALVSVVVELRQVTGLNGALWEMELAPGGRPYANLAQPNQLATLLLLGFVSSIYLFWKKKIGKFGFCVIGLYIGLGLAIAQSRTSVISAIVLAGWYLLRKPESKVSSQRSDDFLVVIALVAFCFLWVSWPALQEYMLLNGSADVRGFDDNARLIIWKQMLGAVVRAPFFGYGWWQISFAQLEVVNDYIGSVQTFSAHNIFLDLIVWNGIPLGGLVSLMVIYWGGRNALARQSFDSWYAMSSIGVVMVHALLEYPLYYAYFLFPVALMVACVDSLNSTPVLKCSKLLLNFGALIGLALLSAVLYEYPKAEARIRVLRFESMGMVDNSDSSKNYQEPLRVLTQIQGFVDFARSTAVEGMTERQLEDMRYAAHRFPFPPSLFRYALALALNGHQHESEAEMMRLRSLHGEKHYQDAKRLMLSLTGKHQQILKLSLP